MLINKILNTHDGGMDLLYKKRYYFEIKFGGKLRKNERKGSVEEYKREKENNKSYILVISFKFRASALHLSQNSSFKIFNALEIECILFVFLFWQFKFSNPKQSREP